MKLKICGIKNVSDLEYCINKGIDYIGINFYPKSTRYCKNGDILNYLSSFKLKNTKLVALFVNNSVSEINQILNQYPFTIIQFCGQNLLPAYKSKYEIWMSVNTNNYKQYLDCNKFLFDNSHGSGILFDQIIPNINKPFGIAGGINPQNIKNIKHKYQNAEFLDIASGTEENGVFSNFKIDQLISEMYD